MKLDTKYDSSGLDIFIRIYIYISCLFIIKFNFFKK